jgi:hypothetical protein
MNIINKNTHPESEYGAIHVTVNDRHDNEMNYNDIERVTINDFGIMEITFNDGDSVIRNININITYYITLTKRITDK